MTSPILRSYCRRWAASSFMAVAPKDGHLYGYDLADNKLLYRVPVTTVENERRCFRARQTSALLSWALWAAMNGTPRATIRLRTSIISGDDRLVRHRDPRR